MKSACPVCKTSVDLSIFPKIVHDYIVDGNDFSETTFEGRCKNCRNGIVYSYYPFCDKIISWTKAFEMKSIQAKWLELSRNYKECLYLCRNNDCTAVDFIYHFWKLNNKQAFFVTRENDHNSIRCCRMSFIPIVVFPDSFFTFSDSINKPSIFAERILSSFVKAPFCISDTYLDNFLRFEL